MTTKAAAKAAIRARLEAQWAEPGVTIAWQNEAFTPPEPPAPWLYVEILWADGRLSSIASTGNHTFNYDGIVFAHVFVPTQDGGDEADDLVEAVANIFRGASFSGVVCYGDRPGGGGRGDDDGNYYRQSVAIPFEIWDVG